MPKIHDSIRERIHQLISKTKIVTQPLPPGGLRELAVRTGVSVELLEEARLRARLNIRVRDITSKIYVNVPLTLFPILLTEAKKYNTSAEGLLVSLNYWYLTSAAWDPPLYPQWIVKGIRHKTYKPSYILKANLNPSAVEALEKRAQIAGMPKSRILRGLIIEFLEKRFPYDVVIVNQMRFPTELDEYPMPDGS